MTESKLIQPPVVQVPSLTITVAPDGTAQMTSNITDADFVIELLVGVTQQLLAQRRISKQQTRGGILLPKG